MRSTILTIKTSHDRFGEDLAQQKGCQPCVNRAYKVVVVTDCVNEAVVAVLLSVQHTVLDEDGDGPQDEGHKQVHVNEVPGAVELPGEKRERKYITCYPVFTPQSPTKQI